MNACIYATQHAIWLDNAVSVDATKHITFCSNKKWSTAKKLLEPGKKLPILFRRHGDDTQKLVCRYLANLTDVTFRKDLANDAKRLHWIDEKLWFQRQEIKKQKRTPRYPKWELQFKGCEVDKFMEATTWYTFANVREITPLALQELRKLDDNLPLAQNYTRGYALCHYPEGKIKVIRSRG